jgi:hypothetical protein
VEFLANVPDRRLGARFEALWHFFLAQHSFYEVLAHNFQVVEHKQTLGSLDLLIRDYRLQQVVHLELAVKFYLHVPWWQGNALEQWLGPNPDDNLGIKIRHLLEHQLPLTELPATQASLKARALPLPDRKAAVVKGYLFHHLNSNPTLPYPINPGCLGGRWLYASQIAQLEGFDQQHWQVLEKTLWLDPLPETGSGGSHGQIARAQLLHHLQNTGQPMLLQSTHPGAFPNDCGRIFLMPEGWCQRATGSESCGV